MLFKSVTNDKKKLSETEIFTWQTLCFTILFFLQYRDHLSKHYYLHFAKGTSQTIDKGCVSVGVTNLRTIDLAPITFEAPKGQ